MKKIIFPFYKKELHNFLTKKWWFRTIIVIYVIAFIVTPFILWFWHVNAASSWCYDTLWSYSGFAFGERLSECSQLAREAWISGIPIAILGWLVFHYLSQIIFFKIIINYIILGGKKKNF